MTADRPATTPRGSALQPSPLQLAVTSARARVREFLTGSEQVFLETGEALDVLRGQATTLVAMSVSVADAARATDDQPVDRLAQGCRQMDQHLGATQTVLESKAQRLRAVLTALDRLTSFRLLFRRAGSALRMLGMSTEIENARGGKESTGFATVAGDVRRLGGLIESKLDGVLGEALSMRRTAEDALARVTDMTARQDGRTSAILADAAAGLESLRDLGRAAAEVGVKTAGVSRDVVSHVGRVVVSLQAHDITRQMMEHVVEGLGEIEAESHAGAAADLAGVAGRADLAGLADLGRLQASQLRQARLQFEKALREIPTSLRAMSAATQDLAQHTRRLAAGQEDGSSLEEVERGIERAGGALREQLQHESDVERAMEKVMATIGDMLTRLRDVERIGKELKIIGLNAGVEAAKTTNGGPVMSVLARTIQELSNEVGNNTAAFAGVVHEIASQASSSNTGANSDAGRHDGEAIARELERLLGDLRSYSQRLSGAIESMATGASAMGRAVDDITARIESQKEAATALASAEVDLESASTALAPAGRAREAGAPSQRMGAVSARYTVEAERAIHQKIMGGGGGGAGGTTAAPRGPAAGAGGATSSTDPELGDNVELF
jgi:hypothetical protein